MPGQIDRFLNMVTPEPNSGCWLWLGTANDNGSGNLRATAYLHRRLKINAAKVSWILFRGQVQPGHVICHSCDNPMCVNPDHLWSGTQKENVADMYRKGRQRNRFGENHAQSKLTKDQVSDIFFGNLTHREYVLKYGVHQSQISRIKSGKRRQKETSNGRP